MILDLTLLRRSWLLQQSLLVAGATIGDGGREGWFGSLCCIIAPVYEWEGAPELCSPFQSILLHRCEIKKKPKNRQWINPEAESESNASA